MTPKPYKSGQIFGYLEHIGKGENLPLLIFCSGYGERGNGSLSDLQKLYTHGPPKLIKAGKWVAISGDRFNVVAPQDPDNILNPDLFHKFIQNMKLLYKTDTVYLTGLSAGGITIWNYLEKHAQDKEVKAVIPICGNGNNAVRNNLQAVSEIPLWAFHGASDTNAATKVGASVNPVLTINKSYPAAVAKVTVYSGCGHDSWTRTYDLTGMKSVTTYDPFDISIYDWLLNFKSDGI